MSDAQGSRLGTMFGPYYLKRLLGRGGMGEVYEAEHTVKQWTVALKLMSHTFSQDPVFRKRMEREARVTGRLLEPHVVPVHEYGEIDGQLFLEMRLIEGTDLGNLLERDGALSPPGAVAIITQIASALDAAHAAGVMHRDVKPQNILINRGDFAYLVDFGIASARTDEKLTEMGTAVGTWKYMAPERFSNDEPTVSADIYALACVLYECLTGAPPYRSSSTAVVITGHMLEPIPQPSVQTTGVPEAFDKVIARGMAKNPDDRYASAGALAEAAHEALNGLDRDRAHTILRRSDVSTPSTAETQPNAAAPVSTAPGTRIRSTAPIVPSAEPASAPVSVSAPLPHLPSSERGALTAGDQPSGAVADDPVARRKGNRWLIVAAAILVVVPLGAIGIWLTVKPSGQPPPQAGVATTAPPAAPGLSDDQARLLGLLPPGYPAGTCTPATTESGGKWANAVAVVSCGQNTQPGGPSQATYGLFPNPDNLKKTFDGQIGNVSLVSCPGEGPSPAGWHYDQTPNVIVGSIACGTNNNRSNLIWTTDDKLMLGDVSADSTTLEDLHKWWASYG